MYQPNSERPAGKVEDEQDKPTLPRQEDVASQSEQSGNAPQPIDAQRAGELAAVDRMRSATKFRPPRVMFLKSDGGWRVAYSKPVPLNVGAALVMESLGITDDLFFDDLLRQLMNAGPFGSEPDEGSVNFMLSVIRGIKPKDNVEAMLGAQMAALHMAAMSTSRTFALTKTIEQQDSAERTYNRLMRTFAMLMDALKRYRSGGQQRVTVEHVTVNEGGQAIVGNVEAGRRTTKRRRKAPRLSDRPGSIVDVPVHRPQTTEPKKN